MRDVLQDISGANLREAVIDMFDAILTDANAGSVDIFVLSARRLSCLYSTLVDAGMPAIPAVVVTSHSIGLDVVQQWSGQNVCIVDDSIVVGSTLAFLKRDLIRRVETGSVTIRAICIDEGQVAPKLLEELAPIGPCIALDSDRTRQFSFDLAKCLFRTSMPYFSDLLVTEPVAFTSPHLDMLINAEEWFAADVTTSLLADANTISYSFFPSDKLAAEIKQAVIQIDSLVAQNIALLKARTFVRTRAEGGTLRVVPIALLKPMADLELRAGIEHFWNHFGIPHLDISRWDAPSRHRYLQLLCSVAVLRPFARLFSEVGIGPPGTLSLPLEQPFMETNFGVLVMDSIQMMIQAYGESATAQVQPPSAAGIDSGGTELDELEPSIAARLDTEHDFLSIFPPASLPGKGEILMFGTAELAAVADVFVFIDQTLEKQERAAIKEMDPAQFFEQYPDMSRRRLNQGISFSNMQRVLHRGRDFDAAVLTSLAIDICNDVGIAVPETRMRHDQKVSRYYRIGENSVAGLMHDLLPRVRTEAISTEDLFKSPGSRKELQKLTRVIDLKLPIVPWSPTRQEVSL